MDSIFTFMYLDAFIKEPSTFMICEARFIWQLD